jgi:DNA polymerase III delta subunit
MLAVRLNLTQYQQILTALQECEFKIKIDSKIDKKSIFLSTLIKIQTKLL